MIEKNFDIPFIADLPLREKQIRQNHRPIIEVYKWLVHGPAILPGSLDSRGVYPAHEAGPEWRPGILTDFCYKGAIKWV
jgi:hypothetical protein